MVIFSTISKTPLPFWALTGLETGPISTLSRHFSQVTTGSATNIRIQTLWCQGQLMETRNWDPQSILKKPTNRCIWYLSKSYQMSQPSPTRLKIIAYQMVNIEGGIKTWMSIKAREGSRWSEISHPRPGLQTISARRISISCLTSLKITEAKRTWRQTIRRSKEP